MLPPFVPPSARAAAESLPLITEFVLHRGELGDVRGYTGVGTVGSAAATAVEPSLPPITDFAIDRRDDHAPHAPAIADAAGDAGHDTGLASVATENVAADAEGWHTQEPIGQAQPSGVTGASIEEATGGDHPNDDVMASVDSHAEMADDSVTPAAGWIDEERNAFDWHAIAGLATPPSEERRAEDEWDSTEWDKPSAAVSDHVAGMLARVARQVRSGELKVDGTHGMSAEAALAATLAALLRSDI